MRPALPASMLAAAVLATAAAPATTGAAVPVPSRWSGTIRGTVYGQAFDLPFTVELTRRYKGESNPIHLFAGTRSAPSTDVGSSFLTSASRFITPITGRRVTLRYLRVARGSRTVRGTLVDLHKAEAAVVNGFTAPNVCLTVYTPFECVLPGPEQFWFVTGATVQLRVSGRRMTGTMRGRGSGYTQVLPYPEVRYQGTISARRRR